MKLQTGKYYRTKVGSKVGPMLYETGTWHEPTTEQIWNSDGTVMLEDGDESHDYIVAEWGEPTMKLWRDMTPEEKGALLLAHHEGEVIQFWSNAKEWVDFFKVVWNPDFAYRIRLEPKVETVVIGYPDDHGNWHEIGLIDLIDGKPDPASIKMEALD